MPDKRLLVGEITSAHGIKGLVKIRSFTQAPADILAYGPLYGETGAVIEVSRRGPLKGGILAALPGVNDRNGAEALKGTRLYVARGALPELAPGEDEYYHADLIGLAVELADGTAFGEVLALHDFGAGAMLEVRPEGSGQGARTTIMVPFNHAAVPEVDLANRRVVIAAPDDDDQEDGDQDDGGQEDDREERR